MPSNKKRRGKGKKKNKTKEEKNNDANQQGRPPAGLAFVQAAYQRAEDQHKEQVAYELRQDAFNACIGCLQNKQQEYDDKVLARMKSYENLAKFFEEEENDIVDLVISLRINELPVESNGKETWWEKVVDATGASLEMKKIRHLLREGYLKSTIKSLAEYDRTSALCHSQRQTGPCLHGGPLSFYLKGHPVRIATTVWLEPLMGKSLVDDDVSQEKLVESNTRRVPGSQSQDLSSRWDSPGGDLRQNILLSAKILQQRFPDLRKKDNVKLFELCICMCAADILLGTDGIFNAYQVIPDSNTGKEPVHLRMWQEIKVEFMAGLVICLEALMEVDGDESSMKSREYEMEKKLRDMHSGGARSCISFFHKRLPCNCLGPMYRELKSQPKTYQCYCCHKQLYRPSLCTRCKIANYCDSNCQREHWPAHKSFCKHACSLIVDDDTPAATATAATEALRTDSSK
mmetsp:Transcript_7889/g.19680  ORF Transcript_7889/g.19680 Transcript_7889/m.19680 type:complete len:458 (+) Transcript_7889:145-1518(+)|eukprot:CAMPEP_0113470230 /NCGR_PEP_ID=MMETSP0014_2-20120614/16329_1 /TAXON_ID=2857 /ORGANISM="Nitzschia sp." /LENGTH=457 /DNA_ID=CAMNT_0000362775 /DNA_START=51 /DNA_END=1424 /DNA_ORIENTATION=+ /assembly_acc=CAM_ASM_000159